MAAVRPLVPRDAGGKGGGAEASEAVAELLSAADAVFCTCCVAGGYAVRNMAGVDVLVIDEAAQAVEPEVALPFLCRPACCVLAGDPRQLGATLVSGPARAAGFDQSVLARLMDRCGVVCVPCLTPEP